MTKKIFTLLFVMIPFLNVLGQIPTPSLVAGNSDIINLTSSAYPPMLVQSGSEEFFWLGASYQGTSVDHPMLNEVYSDFSNLYFIKYDKDGNPLASANIRGSYLARGAFSFGGGLTVLGNASNDIEANGNTLPINSADRLEFIAK